MTKDEALDLALEALDNLLYWDNGKSDYDQAREAITAIKQALAAPTVQEPVAYRAWVDGWQYTEIPGDGEALCLCTPPAAQRTWVELSGEDKKIIRDNVGYDQFMTAGEYAHLVQEATEAKLKEKNT
jgi:hypothetical protein